MKWRSGWCRPVTRRALAGADARGRVVVSSDTDLGALHARRELASPSFVLIRHVNELTPSAQGALLTAAIGEAETDFEAGAVVTIARGRNRVPRCRQEYARSLHPSGRSSLAGEQRPGARWSVVA
jgi:predicted nuclease of predicted toxin-antitoxin system